MKIEKTFWTYSIQMDTTSGTLCIVLHAPTGRTTYPLLVGMSRAGRAEQQATHQHHTQMPKAMGEC